MKKKAKKILILLLITLLTIYFLSCITGTSYAAGEFVIDDLLGGLIDGVVRNIAFTN